MDLLREHVEAALNEVDSFGIPPRRRSTKYCLVDRGKHYPPKYVRGLAYKFKGEGGWLPNEFSGGENTNRELENLDYKIEPCTCKNLGIPDLV